MCNYTPDFPSSTKDVRLRFGSSYHYILSGNNNNNNNSLVQLVTRTGLFKG